MEKFLNNFWNEPVPKKNAFLKGHCPENIYLPSLLNVPGGQLGPGQMNPRYLDTLPEALPFKKSLWLGLTFVSDDLVFI